jgi:DNA helicase-2/ATP-dependent DNA helicase PcrA
MLTACPGSGKTRVIVSKLARVIEEVRGTSRRVACITYTNAAVHEIEGRLKHHIQPGDEEYYDVGTIHAFCLQHIFRPFRHLIPGFSKGFKVLIPDSQEFRDFVTATWVEENRFNLAFKDFEDFAQLRRNTEGRPVGIAIDRGNLTPGIAKKYWDRIRTNGYIDFSNIIYYSYLLLKNRPEVLSYASSKFSWILVDEFQDTTDLQVEILSLIAGAKQTKFLLVGDPFQSIFSFAGARPDLAEIFATRIGARRDKQLSANFRSSTPIVDEANSVFTHKPAMVASGKAKLFTEIPIWKHGTSSFNVITDYFLPIIEDLKIPLGDSAILAPTWYPLFPLGRRLREYGVSIVGPGARPYRRSSHFAPLAEHVCGYLMDSQPDAISNIERSLFNTLHDITGRPNFGVFSYDGRVVVFRLLDEALRLKDLHPGAIAWLEAASKAFSEILISAGYLTAAEREIFPLSTEEMKADMVRNNVDVSNLSLDDLGIYASPQHALKLSSLHNAKGREYSAVAMIDVHEGKIPHYMSKKTHEIEEAKRLFYVGITRAKRVLLYITDDTERRNGPTRFLDIVPTKMT